MNREGRTRTAREYARHLRDGDVIRDPFHPTAQAFTVEAVHHTSPSSLSIDLYERMPIHNIDVRAVLEVLAGPSTQLDATIWDQEQAEQAGRAVDEKPAKTEKKRRRWPWIAAVPVAFFAGVVLGVAPTDTTATTATPPVNEAVEEPAPTVTVTPDPKVVTKTETNTVTKRVVPQSCLDGLDAAESLVHEVMIPFGEVTIDLLDATNTFDLAGIESATAEIDRLTSRTERIVAEYNAAADECRMAARR